MRIGKAVSACKLISMKLLLKSRLQSSKKYNYDRLCSLRTAHFSESKIKHGISPKWLVVRNDVTWLTNTETHVPVGGRPAILSKACRGSSQYRS